jgi:hypothetical protein
MKSFEEFEDQFERFESGTQSALDPIQARLREFDRSRTPDPQSQRWAWTRLQSRLHAPADHSDFSLIRLAGWGLAAAAVFWVGLQLLPNQGPEQTVASGPVTINSTQPGIHAVSFNDPDVVADVVWVSGYEYMPASHNLR